MRSPTALPRLLLALLVASVLVALVLAVVTVRLRPPGPGDAVDAADPVAPAVAAAVTPGATTSYAGRVLRRWDARRSAAWAHADVAALRALYAPRSTAGRADARMLSRWRARGLRVTGVHLRVLRLVTLSRSPARLVLRVTDQEEGAVARGRGAPVLLPRDLPSSHLVELWRSSAGSWRVASVR